MAEDVELHTGVGQLVMRVLKRMLGIFSRRRKNRGLKKRRSAKREQTARTSKVLHARQSAFIPMPPDKKK